jgi:hypothetical protein
VRIIFSRKGFDNEAGKAPSPIVNGEPISLPIPTYHRSNTSYDDLGLGEVVERTTKMRILRHHLCHNDPMFCNGRCAFGQTGKAQSHLARNGVQVGDVFLFFGLFQEEDTRASHHRIFGFMRVEEVIQLGTHATPEAVSPRLWQRHPHTIGEWNHNNTLYTGPGRRAKRATGALRLTAPGGPVSLWRVPPWLHRVGLTYHTRADRWLDGDRLRAAGRGQEFVADVGDHQEAHTWLNRIVEEIKR